MLYCQAYQLFELQYISTKKASFGFYKTGTWYKRKDSSQKSNDQAWNFCGLLTEKFNFVRVDLYNVDGKIYFAIKSIYNESQACEKLNSYLTDWFDCKNGVRQGDTLSPTLFSVFINDLPAFVW